MTGSEIIPASGPRPRWYVIDRAVVAVTAAKTRVFTYRRDADWNMAILAIAMGLVLLQPAMTGLRVGTTGSWTWHITSVGWASALLTIGLLRVVAIKINGTWQSGRSALIRAGAACFGVTFWATIAYTSFLREGGQAIGFFTLLFGWLTWLEVRCAMRAVDDRRTIREASRLAGVPPDGT